MIGESKKKILLVEDEEFLRDLLSTRISKEGYKILHAKDGAEALKIAKTEKPDGVLLGLVLPGISGFDVLMELKKDHETAAIPVVILSNLGEKEDIERGKKLGAVDYLVKANFSIDEVIERVNTFFDGKK